MDYMSHEVVRLLADMVKIESTNVGKYEGEMADFVADWLERETGQGITAQSCFLILSRNIQRFFTAKISASQSSLRQLFPREWQAF